MFRTPAAVIALLAGGLLAGCNGDDPKPDITDPTSSAPTAPTSSATVVSTPPTVSATATLDAVGTVREWITARNEALQDGDTSEVDALSSSECRSCDELNKVIRDVYAAGGNFQTKGWSVDSIQLKPDTDPIEVDAALIFAPGQTVPSAGADPVPYNQEKHIVIFRLAGAKDSLKVQLVLFP